MKQGRPLAEVISELKRQNELKKDYIAPAKALRLEDDGETFILRHNDGTQEVFDMTDLFHRQTGSALEIPARYYDLMRRFKPDLLARNVNTWFGNREQKYMLRSLRYSEGHNANGKSGVVRALLSDRYLRIDNMQIAADVLPLFAGQRDMEVASSAITNTHLHIKIVNHRLEREVKPGDIVQAGVVISNSEVGLGAVSVQPLVYRLVCLNGLIVSDFGERRTHIGRPAEIVDERYNIYSDETREAEDKLLILKLRDATKAALDEARFSMIVDRLRESTEAKITGHVQNVIELTARTYGLNQEEQESILDYLVSGGDLSLYGLSNAVTRASQNVESYNRATMLESIGWQVVTMSKSQWREINR